MKIVTPAYFSQFHCIASDCPETCCAGWEVVVDPESEARYRALQTPLGDRIRGMMMVEDGETCFHCNPDGRCPFLNDRNLCDIQAEMGEEALCRTCHIYPRFIHDFGGTREMGISISCPEAARIIFSQTGKIQFTSENRPDIPPSLNDMDADRYFAVIQLRETAYDLIQRSQFPMDHRCALLLRLARKGQKLIREQRWEDIQALCDSFDPHQILAQLKKCRSRCSMATAVKRNDLLTELLKLDILKDSWKEQLVNCLESENSGDRTVNALNAGFEQNLLFTFLFRYFARAAYPGAEDDTLLGLVKFAVFSLLAVRTLGQDMTESELEKLAVSYSREVEHDEDNVAALVREMTENKTFTEKAFCALLLGTSAQPVANG